MSTYNLEELISQLKAIDPKYEFKKFDIVIQKIGKLHQPSSISRLSEFFNDDIKNEDVMYSIIHTIEDFDDPTYVNKFLEVIPTIFKNSPHWASILLMRILNSESTVIELIKQIKESSSETKNSVRGLLEEINQVSPEFITKTVAVLAVTL